MLSTTPPHNVSFPVPDARRQMSNRSASVTAPPSTLTMRPLDIIRKKRDGGELSADEIQFLVRAYTNDQIPDYQMAAWLMAVLIRGMTGPELSALTSAMLHSGEVLDLSDLPGAKIDKHSTGGVGDKTSLIIAPVVAAAGITVPMISGRGLGHTGGTLDKLQSIPGFNINLSLSEFRRVLKACGCGLIGQTAEIAPGRQEAICSPRCHRDRGESQSDLRLDHEQEAGRGHRRPGAGREDWFWRIHEDRGRFGSLG